ncbi:hypothetical protein NQ314_014786 [Rhamnusium bicolor]|uniref:Apoptotic protease-activating factor 1 n=1 Tax=Rhamnusium bicolor TaxID=1586634 RepID=A0AAV8X0U4_9CUCU|nr:hypothetical protein NQ314_014786 [Rhamnusium bicolor]
MDGMKLREHFFGQKVHNEGAWNISLFDYIQTLTISKEPVKDSRIEKPEIKVKCNIQSCKKLELHIGHLAGGRPIVGNEQSRKRNDTLKLLEIFKVIDSNKHEVETVFEYLHNAFPNIGKQEEEEQYLRLSSVGVDFQNYLLIMLQEKLFLLVEDVKSKLLNLQWNQKLVVHGMMGYGKSCLVNEVLQDITVRKCFDNYLFWINLGEHHNKETVLQPLWRLYSTASSILQNRVTHCPDDVQHLKNLLIDLFLHPRLRNALIILDDACSDEVLTCFDIRCRTVITTQNKKILRNEEGIFVEVKTGFSRTESLDLFKKSLKIDHDLPISADDIHNTCKGHPMLIALIGSYLSDNAEDVNSNKNSKIWQYIKEMFLSGKYNLNEYDIHVDIPTLKIQNCIEKLLTNGLKELYHDLAIFMPDINIPPEVLEILWNKNRAEVRNVMNKFAEKSLIVPFYHDDLQTYIYGIHDIHLNYLKDITKERIVSLHKKLISGYDKITQGNYASLPNDNYTLQYIGYHLYHAEDFKKFDIYFDLKFLEAKIKAVGKEDVLRDMLKYEDYITRKENKQKEKLDQYKDFISRCGSNLYSYEKTDIIQFALREKKDSIIFKEAMILAEKSEKLYFQLQRPVNELGYSTINLKDDITSACFVDSPHHILVGTTSGKIKLFYEEYDKEISNFVGHDGAIKKLSISPDKRYFLSVSIDGTVILWKFTPDSGRNSYDFSHTHPVSPKTKQKYWQDVFTPDKGQVKPKHRFQLDEKDDFLLSATFCDKFPTVFRIATGTERGNVIVWDAQTGHQLYKTGHRGYKIPSVIYLENELLNGVIFACSDTIVLYKFSNGLKYYTTLRNLDNCDSVFVNDDTIIAVSEKNITLWEGNKKYSLCENVDNVEKYNICSTLTGDSKFLVVGTSENTVFIWDIEERTLIKEFKNKWLTKSMDTFYDEDKSVHILLIGSDQKTLQQCHILANDKEPQIANAPMFIPYWKKKQALTALVSPDNRIQIFNGYVQISETAAIESQVTYTCFSVCGQNVIYGLENGEVHLFHLRSKNNKCLEDNHGNERGPITYLQCYDLSNNRTQSISSCDSSDSLDFNVSCEGIIVSVSSYNLITIYHNNKFSSKQVNRPLIFFKLSNLIIVDANCSIYIWDLITDEFSLLINSNILEPVGVCTATFCSEKSFLGVTFKQSDGYFFGCVQCCS